MNKYRHLIVSIALFCFPIIIHAQILGNNHKLNEPLSGNLHYIASDYIQCLTEAANSSFSYSTPSATESFHAEIDPFLIVPPEEEPGGPGGVVGNDGMVGSLPGSFNVSGIGAATYSIPIEVPAGRAGITPNISLNYNSMGGNGPLGIGWSIGGLSSIGRTGTNYYNDNPTGDEDWRPDPVDFDEHDRFMLDGQRLVLLDPVNDTYGSINPTEYRTEQESFTRIISYGESGKNGPQYFIAWTKDGKKIEYGRTGNSAMQASGRTDDAVLTWMANKISDRWGNYMEFEYELINSNIRISSIKYTGKMDLTTNTISNNPFYVVEFNYEDNGVRLDEFIKYISGSSITMDFLLKDIRVYHQTDAGTRTRIKTYDINYSGNEFKHIASVQLIGLETNSKLNKTVFERGSEAVNFDKNTVQIPYYANVSGQNWQPLKDYFGDFDGNGKTDIFRVYGYYENNIGNIVAEKWKWYNYNGSNFELKQSEDLPGEYFMKMEIGDINGDGYDDVMRCFVHDDYLRLNMLVSNGDMLIYHTFNQHINLIDNEGLAYDVRPFLADTDGDGLDEVVIVDEFPHTNLPDPYLTRIRTYDLSIAAGTTIDVALQSTKYKNGAIKSDDQVFFVDFNGSGTEDMLFVGEDDFKVYDIKEGLIFEDAYFPNTTDHKKIIWGDYNGDGNIDAVAWNKNSNSWSLNYSNGIGWIQGDCPIQTNIPTIQSETKEYFFAYYAADFNGDGLSDIMEADCYNIPSSYDDYNINIYISKGYHFEDFQTVIQPEDMNVGNFSDNSFTIMDFDGDGRNDIYFRTQWAPSSNMDLWHIRPNDLRHKLVKITNSLGTELNINYGSLANGTGGSYPLYSKGQVQSYPYRTVTPPIWVVSNVFSDMPNGGISEKRYQYRGLQVHLLGKGLLGYQKQTVYDVETNIESKTIFSLDCGSSGIVLNYPKESIQMLRGGTHYLSYSGNTPELHVYSGDTKRFFMYNKKTHAKKWDWDGDRIVTTRNEMGFDPDGLIYGTPSYTISAQDDRDANASFNIENFKFIQRKDFTYENPILASGNSPAWIIGQPETVKTTWKTDAESDIERTTAFEYYNDPSASNYRFLKFKINEPGDGTTPNELETRIEYEYDPYGNIITTTEEAPNYNPSEPLVRIEEFEYLDNDKRFLSRKSKLIGNYTFYYGFGYNEVTGLLSSESDCNGLIKNYEYDDFGRPKETTYTYLDDYDEFIYGRESNALRWTGSHEFEPDNNTSLYYSWSKSAGNPEEYVFFDEFGKKLREVYHGLEDDTWIFHDYKYDDRGRLEYDYEPYYSTASAGNYTFYVYDDLDRPVTITHADGTTTAYEYDARTTTVTHAGQSHTKEVNAAGWDYQSTDNDGNIVQYKHYSDGKVKETFLVADETNTKMSFTYDNYGNRLTMNDPSLGTITSTYNPFGEMLTNTDQKGQLTTYEYDHLGRTTYKKLVDDHNRLTEWTYTYDDVVNKPLTLGMLSHVVKSGQDPHSLDYQYDRTGNVLTETENILNGAEDYILSYTYDTYGRLKTCSYPTGLNISYAYKNGYNTDILDDNHFKSIWHLNELNAMGQTKSYKLGNQLKTDFTYDGSHLPETIKTSLLSNPTNHLQNLEYLWTNEKNLDWKKDFMFPQNTQNYYYEDYSYDDLNRLWNINSNIDVNDMTLTFDNKGNITSKTGLGSYTYNQSGNAGPYAVTATESGGSDQRILYTGFDKIERISSEVYGDNIDDIGIDYGIDNQRIRQTCRYMHNTVEEKTYIFGGMVERIQRGSETHYLSYISSPDGLVAMHISDDAGRDEMKYVLTDYLGTIYALVDDGAQSTDDALYYSFNAWGERRELQAYDGSLTAPLFSDPADYITSRGYTGHEHIDAFDLINMNGRAYDPVVGAFLSPDPYVQAPDMPQNLNRYAYCLNNPLKYTDPSGEFIMTIMFAMMTNVMIQGLSGNMNTMGSFFLAAGIGAASAGVGLATGSIFLGAFFGQTGNSLVNGNNFGQSVLAGLQAGATSVAVAAGWQLISSGAQSAYRAIAEKIEYNRINNQVLSSPMPQKDLGAETGIETTESLRKAAKKYLPDIEDYATDGVYLADDPQIQHAMEKLNAEVKADGTLIRNGKEVGGFTVPFNDGKSPAIFVSPKAAGFQKSLEVILAHELTHAYHFKTGIMLKFASDLAVRSNITEYFAHEINRAFGYDKWHSYRIDKYKSFFDETLRTFKRAKVYPPSIDRFGVWKSWKFR